MKVSPLVRVALGGAIGVAGIVIWNKTYVPERPLSAGPLPTSPPQEITSDQPSFTTGGSAPVAVALPADPTPPPGTPRPRPNPQAVEDIENIQLMLRDFRTRLGGNPEGTNAEIMKGMMGGNTFQANFVPPDGQRLNDQGELLDRWGTAYFFHQLSKTEMEIRSAGPDQKMWTADDILVK